MLCEICKENRATLHMKNNINGVIIERDICGDCYEKLLGSDYAGSLKRLYDSLSKSMENPAAKIRCSVCSTKLSDILETFYVGCPSCYSEFGAYILPSIKNLQNAVLHQGKRPLSMQESIPSEYQRLRNELERAIASENYEQAAIISARLKQLRCESDTGSNK